MFKQFFKFASELLRSMFISKVPRLQMRSTGREELPNVALLYGDPYVWSFDGLMTKDYKGVCTSIVLRDNCEDGYPDGTPTFTIYADYYAEHDDKGSFVRQIYIEIVGKLITIKGVVGQHRGEIFVDSQQITSFPHTVASGVIIKNETEIDVEDGVNVQFKYWNNGMDTYMELPDSFQGKVCGLVGNFNGDKNDDRIVGPFCPCVLNYKPGVITSDLKLFGDSWQTDKFPDIDQSCDMNSCGGTLPPHPCSTATERRAAEQACRIIRTTTEIFNRCMAVVTRGVIDEFFDTCVQDVCATDDPSIADRHLRVLDYYCQSVTGTGKTCTLEKGGLLNTFDGLNLEITKEQKTALARYNPSSTHTCRFEVRAVTTFDCAWERPPQQLPLLIDWIGVSCDKKTRGYYGRRNVLLTQQTNQVRIRGKEKFTVTSFPYTLSLSDGSNVTIERATVGGQVEFRVRSSAACQWGVNWRPDTRDSEADIFFGGNYGGQMEGMCGDADGDMANDWKKCNGPSVTPGPAGSNQITDSCREGKNQGQGIEGCNKTK